VGGATEVDERFLCWATRTGRLPPSTLDHLRRAAAHAAAHGQPVRLVDIAAARGLVPPEIAQHLVAGSASEPVRRPRTSAPASGPVRRPRTSSPAPGPVRRPRASSRARSAPARSPRRVRLLAGGIVTASAAAAIGIVVGAARPSGGPSAAGAAPAGAALVAGESPAEERARFAAEFAPVAKLVATGAEEEALEVLRGRIARLEEGGEPAELTLWREELGAVVLFGRRPPREVLPHLERALAWRTEHRPDADWDRQVRLRSLLGRALAATGERGAALEHFRRGAEIARAHGLGATRDACGLLNEWAWTLEEVGRFDEAIAVAEESSQAGARLGGSRASRPARYPLAILALAQCSAGEPEAALETLVRAEALADEDGEHLTAEATAVAGVVHIALGSPRGRFYLELGLRQLDEAWRWDHPRLARLFVHLARFLSDQAEAPLEAMELWRRAAAAYAAIDGPDDPRAIDATLELAEALARCDRPYAALEALEPVEETLSLAERDWVRGESRTRPSERTLPALRCIYVRSLAGRSRHMLRWATGPAPLEAPRAWQALRADALLLQGRLAAADERFEKARSSLAEALWIRECLHPGGHASIAAPLVELARVAVTTGADDAEELARRALDVSEWRINSVLGALTPVERLELAAGRRPALDAWLEYTRDGEETGYDAVLRFKGRLARLREAELGAVRAAAGEPAANLRRLEAAQRRLAAAVQRGDDRERLAAAREAVEQASLRLASAIPEHEGARRWLGADQDAVRSALRPHEALLDYVRYGRRYACFVIRPEQPTRRVELGPSGWIEGAVAAFVERIRAGASDDAVRSRGAKVSRMLWARVAPHVGDAELVYVVSGGALGPVPFGALPTADGERFLLEERAFASLGSAQELVPWRDPPTGRGAVLVGGVDYGTPPAAGPASGMSFTPLAGAEEEVRACAERLGAAGAADTLVLAGGEASEPRLLEAVGRRRIVHLATHGFCDVDRSAARSQQADWRRRKRRYVDPLLLAGLALAGANAWAGEGVEDGVLTALEASQLDLDGVELVVLSACETADGGREAGEVALGLVHGFRLAGARSVVASLWPVEDWATRVLMDRFYAHAAFAPAGAAEAPALALRRAALDLRRAEAPEGAPRDGFRRPRCWAAFMAHGRQRRAWRE